MEDLLQQLKEMEESRDEWRKNWYLEQAMNKKLEERVKELERETNIYKDERDELRSLHDAGCREAYRICGVEDDGEYRWKWVLLELSTTGEYKKRAEHAESSFTRLLEAVERHKWLKEGIYGFTDEALYQVAEKIKKEVKP